MSNPIAAHKVVVYTPPVNHSQFFAKRELLYRVKEAYTKGTENLAIKHVIKDHPHLSIDAYDLAMEAENKGEKDVADVIRKQTVSVIPTSPLSHDERFLTPKLTGPYVVGVKKYYLEDVSRNEKDLGHDIDRTRRVMIDVHYPAEQSKEPQYRLQPTHTPPDPYEAPPLKVEGGWTRAQPNLHPVTAKKFPVILFSPGMGCPHDDYQEMVEEIASHGFCVITVNSPFISGHSEFLGHNQVKPHDLPKKPYDTQFIQLLESEVENKAQDLKFVISQIKNTEHLSSYMDVDTIGVLGHSLGGAAGIELCKTDAAKEVKAGICLDSTLSGDATLPVKQAFLNILTSKCFDVLDECFSVTSARIVLEKWKKTHQTSYNIVIHNADHMDFTSFDLYDWGEPPSETQIPVRRLSSHYIIEFFQTHLQGKSSELFNPKTIVKIIETYDRALGLEKTARRYLKTPDLILRINSAYARAMEDVDIRSLLKKDPSLIVDAYDAAMAIEKVGKKTLADAIRKETVRIIPSSSKLPDESDERFLIPKLTGPYKVIGVKKYYLEDISRNYLDRTRRIMIDAHYPAEQSKEKEYKLQTARTDGPLYGPPLKIKGGWTRSQPDLVPLAQQKFPIVLFSPGLGCPHDMYQHMVEELTSYGFCVITVNSSPCYHIPFLGSHEENFPDGNELANNIDNITMDKAKDLEFVIEQIKNDKIQDLEKVVDVKTIGVLGHSIGGASAAQVCKKDETGAVKAGINMDGSLRGNSAGDPLDQPFLHITSTDAFTSTNENAQESLQNWKKFHELSPSSHWLFLHNADHMDFTSFDLYDWSKPPSETQIPVRRLSTHYIIEFFQTHLQGKSSELFNPKTIVKIIETYNRALGLEKTARRLLDNSSTTH